MPSLASVRLGVFCRPDIERGLQSCRHVLFNIQAFRMDCIGRTFCVVPRDSCRQQLLAAATQRNHTGSGGLPSLKEQELTVDKLKCDGSTERYQTPQAVRRRLKSMRLREKRVQQLKRVAQSGGDD